MRRTLIGAAAIVVLLVVIGLTSDFAPGVQVRPQPSEVGVDEPTGRPFEIGTVLDAQSFR